MPTRDLAVLGIVPARGGSKGIPRKNMIAYRGKPLIGHTLDAVAQVLGNENVVVSTDCAEITSYAEEKGFSSAYARPAHLALDETPMSEVILDALNWYEEQVSSPDYVLVLQPTSPLRGSLDIHRSIEHLRRERPLALVSVHPMREHPMECIQVSDDGSWRYLMSPPVGVTRRQEYESGFYFVNGAMYAVAPSALRRHMRFVLPGTDTQFFPMDPRHGLDIDSWQDLLE